MKKLTSILILMCCMNYVGAKEVKEPKNWGFIFNTSSLLLDIESYQAGLGAKVLLNDTTAFRFLFDVFYSSSSDTFSATVSPVFEKYIIKGRVSPYWGAYIEAGFMSQNFILDSANWTKNYSILFSGGPIFGVEVFLFEFLSFFAEYNLDFQGVITFDSSSAAGVVTTSEPGFSYSVDLGIGNEAKLGIIIYLNDVIEIDRESND